MAESTMTPFEDALRRIVEQREIWVRLAAVRLPDGQWHSRLLELTSGAAPPSWTPRVWEYPDASFAGTTQSGPAIGKWFEAGKARIGNYDVNLPQRTQSIRWERQQSHWAGACEPLDWPAVETNLAERTTYGGPNGILVSQDAPSFLNFYTAGACFFWRDRRPSGGSLYEGVVYRHQDTRGRLNGVRIGRDGIEIQVEGSAIRGMIVELAGETPGPQQQLKDDDSIQKVTFPLRDGLPEGTWVLLRAGREWIDRRYLNVPWSQGAEPGVEFVVEPGTRLEVFLANREGPQVDFKRQVPSDDEGKPKVMKTICAFANGDGGSILFGIDDEEGLVGLPPQAVDRLKDDLTRMIRTWVEPGPSIDFEMLPISDTDQIVLELRVEAGSTLYGCGRTADARTIYVRHYATTVRARLPEIVAILQARPGAVHQANELGLLLPANLVDTQP